MGREMPPELVQTGSPRKPSQVLLGESSKNLLLINFLPKTWKSGRAIEMHALALLFCPSLRGKG